MNSTSAFEIQLPGCLLRRLQETDIEDLQRLCEKCEDYFWIADGEEVPPTAAKEMFYAGPPGRSLEEKFLFGLFNPRGEMIAVLEGFKHYPEDDTWWIGLFMVAPQARGQGIGGKLINAFTRYVHEQGGGAIMLGVVEDNSAAYAFWQQMGFSLQSQREPRQFGKKFQAVYVMRRSLVDNALAATEDNSITI